MLFVIEDEETGNYVSSDSVLKLGKTLYYVTHNGRADGLEYHKTAEGAGRILHNLEEKFNKYKIHKNLKVVQIDKNGMPMGYLIKEQFAL